MANVDQRGKFIQDMEDASTKFFDAIADFAKLQQTATDRDYFNTSTGILDAEIGAYFEGRTQADMINCFNAVLALKTFGANGGGSTGFYLAQIHSFSE